ncbi:MAG: hypothetical protein V4515_14330 [Chloroflexota bacterium]
MHHSGGLRAKRRWLAWRRYQRRCDALVGVRSGYGHWRTMQGRLFDGYARAGARWCYVGRYAPIGIRDVRA